MSPRSQDSAEMLPVCRCKNCDAIKGAMVFIAAAQALGALALGAAAVGAVAVGALAVGSLVVGRAQMRRVEIDELVVRKLCITEDLQVPPEAR